MQMTLEKAIEIIADEFQVNAASELVRDPKPRAIESIAYEYGRLEALDWCLSLLANNYRAPIYAHKTFRMKCWETPISVRPFAELVARRRRNAQKQLKAVNE